MKEAHSKIEGHENRSHFSNGYWSYPPSDYLELPGCKSEARRDGSALDCWPRSVPTSSYRLLVRLVSPSAVDVMSPACTVRFEQSASGEEQRTAAATNPSKGPWVRLKHHLATACSSSRKRDRHAPKPLTGAEGGRISVLRARNS